MKFTLTTKLAANKRAGGFCEMCGKQFKTGEAREYDHRNADYFSQDNSLENCVIACVQCHRQKTSTADIPAIAKSRRIRAREAGIKKPGTIKGWRKFDGTPVLANERKR